jgi:hypothetical protein
MAVNTLNNSFPDFYYNGDVRFTVPKVIPPGILPSSLPSNIINIVLGIYIKTNVVGQSFKIVNSSNTIICHFIIKQVAGWTLQGAQIALASSDQIVYYLIFSTEAEASTADARLYSIMEGGDET